MQQVLHSVVGADLHNRTVPIAVLALEHLGLHGLAECQLPGADGKAAAQIVLDAIRTHFEIHQDVVERFLTQPTDLLRTEIMNILKEAVNRAGLEAFALLRRKGRHAGISVDVLLLSESEAFAAHVGAGRIYLLRKDLLHRLTLTRPDEVGDPTPQGDGLPLALLGTEPRVAVETLCVSFSPGDRLIVGTGAMARAIDERNIRSFTEEFPPPQTIQGLLNLARDQSPSQPLAVMMTQAPGESPSMLDNQARLGVLTRMPLFAYCTQEELHSVAGAAQPRSIKRGETLFRQGESSQEMFLLVQGEIALFRNAIEVARVGPGTNFGEMSMLDEPNRSASAVAVSDTELLVIGREAFFGLLMGNPTLAVKILWNMLLKLSDNLRRTTSRLSELADAGTPPNTRLKPDDMPW